jgi:hypothetical protein
VEQTTAERLCCPLCNGDGSVPVNLAVESDPLPNPIANRLSDCIFHSAFGVTPQMADRIAEYLANVLFSDEAIEDWGIRLYAVFEEPSDAHH